MSIDVADSWFRDNAAVDGDTLRYIDGDTVARGRTRERLVGGDAPELAARKGGFLQHTEPGAQIATQWLEENLPKADERVAQGQGRFGRDLVDYRRGGESLMNQAVRAGVAFPDPWEESHASDRALSTSFINRATGNRTSWDDKMDAARAVNPPDTHFAANFDRSIRHESTSSRAIDRGMAMLEGSIGAAGNFFGAKLGIDSLESGGAKLMADSAVEAALNPADVASFEDVHGLSDFGTYIKEKVGESLPMLGSLALGAAVGGATAPALAAGIGKAFLQRTFQKEALKRIAAWGARTGLVATDFPQRAGLSWQELHEKGVKAEDTNAPIFVGAVNTALDVLPGELLMRYSFGGLSPDLAREVVQQNLRTLTAKGVVGEVLKGTGKGAVLGAGIGAPVGFAQELVNLSALAYHDPNFDWGSPEVKHRLTEAAIAMTAVGGVLGAATGGGHAAFRSVRDLLKQRAAETTDSPDSADPNGTPPPSTPPPAADGTPPTPPPPAPPRTVPERPGDIAAQLKELADSSTPGRVRYFQTLNGVELPSGLEASPASVGGTYVIRRGDEVARKRVQALDRAERSYRDRLTGGRREGAPTDEDGGALPGKAPRIATRKVASVGDGSQYGASVGNARAGTKRHLVNDPDGGYFWGAPTDFEPAVFPTPREARAAAKSTPQDRTSPSNPDAARSKLLGYQQTKEEANANGAPTYVQGLDAQGNEVHGEVVDSTNPEAVAGAYKTARERGAVEVNDRDPREVIAERQEPPNLYGGPPDEGRIHYYYQESIRAGALKDQIARAEAAGDTARADKAKAELADTEQMLAEWRDEFPGIEQEVSKRVKKHVDNNQTGGGLLGGADTPQRLRVNAKIREELQDKTVEQLRRLAAAKRAKAKSMEGVDPELADLVHSEADMAERIIRERETSEAPPSEPSAEPKAHTPQSVADWVDDGIAQLAADPTPGRVLVYPYTLFESAHDLRSKENFGQMFSSTTFHPTGGPTDAMLVSMNGDDVAGSFVAHALKAFDEGGVEAFNRVVADTNMVDLRGGPPSTLTKRAVQNADALEAAAARRGIPGLLEMMRGLLKTTDDEIGIRYIEELGAHALLTHAKDQLPKGLGLVRLPNGLWAVYARNSKATREVMTDSFPEGQRPSSSDITHGGAEPRGSYLDVPLPADPALYPAGKAPGAEKPTEPTPPPPAAPASPPEGEASGAARPSGEIDTPPLDRERIRMHLPFAIRRKLQALVNEWVAPFGVAPPLVTVSEESRNARLTTVGWYVKDTNKIYLALDLAEKIGADLGRVEQLRTLEMLAHEVGHALDHLIIESAPPGRRQALEKAYQRWLAAQEKRTDIDVLSSRTLGIGRYKAARSSDLRKQSFSFENDYARSRAEWFADQIGRYLIDGTIRDNSPVFRELVRNAARLFVRLYRRIAKTLGWPTADRDVANFLDGVKKRIAEGGTPQTPPEASPPPPRPTRIISGGQTGADIGGLIGARRAGIETGGTAPKGFKTDAGGNPELGTKYGVREHRSPSYVPRTIENINKSDGTVAFRFGPSVGTDKTIGYARSGHWEKPEQIESRDDGHRPVLVIDTKDKAKAIRALRDFVQRNKIKTLNVAGHRERSQPGLEAFVASVIAEAFAPTKADSGRVNRFGEMASGKEPTGMAQPEELGTGPLEAPPPKTPREKAAERISPWAPSKPSAEAKPASTPNEAAQAQRAADQALITRVHDLGGQTKAKNPARAIAAKLTPEEKTKLQQRSGQKLITRAIKWALDQSAGRDISHLSAEERAQLHKYFGREPTQAEVDAELARLNRDSDIESRYTEEETDEMLAGEGANVSSGEPLDVNSIDVDLHKGAQTSATIGDAAKGVGVVLGLIRSAIPEADALEADGQMHIPSKAEYLEHGDYVDLSGGDRPRNKTGRYGLRVEGLRLPPPEHRPPDMSPGFVRHLVLAAAVGPTKPEAKVTLRSGKGPRVDFNAVELIFAGDALYEGAPPENALVRARASLGMALAWLAEHGGYRLLDKDGNPTELGEGVRVGKKTDLTWGQVEKALENYPNTAEAEIDALVGPAPRTRGRKAALAALDKDKKALAGLRQRLKERPTARLQVLIDERERSIAEREQGIFGLVKGSEPWRFVLRTKREELRAQLEELKTRREARTPKEREEEDELRLQEARTITKQIAYIDKLFEEQDQPRGVSNTSNTRNFEKQTTIGSETKTSTRTTQVPERRAKGGERMRKSGYVQAGEGVIIAPSRAVHREVETEVSTRQPVISDSETALRSVHREANFRVIRTLPDKRVVVENLDTGVRSTWTRAALDEHSPSARPGTRFSVQRTTQEEVALGATEARADLEEAGGVGDTRSSDDSRSDSAAAIVDSEDVQAARSSSRYGDARSATRPAEMLGPEQIAEMEAAKREVLGEDFDKVNALGSDTALLPGTKDASLTGYAEGARRVFTEVGVRLKSPVRFTDLAGIDALLARAKTSEVNRAVLEQLKADQPLARVLFLEDGQGHVHPVIYVSDKFSRPEVRHQAVLHELGHVVLRHALATAPEEVIAALEQVLGHARTDPLRFEESFANRFTEWAGEKARRAQADPASRRIQRAVEKFFQSMWRTLRRIYQQFTREHPVEQEFSDFMETLVNRNRHLRGEAEAPMKTELGRRINKAMEAAGLTGVGALPRDPELPAYLDYTPGGPPIPPGRRRRLANSVKTWAEFGKLKLGRAQAMLTTIWDMTAAPYDSVLRRMGLGDWANEFRHIPGERRQRRRMEFYAEERQVLHGFLNQIEGVTESYATKLRPWHLVGKRPPVNEAMRKAFLALEGKPVVHTTASLEVYNAFRGFFNSLHQFLNDHHVPVKHRQDYAPVVFDRERLYSDEAKAEFINVVTDWSATPEGQAWWHERLNPSPPPGTPAPATPRPVRHPTPENIQNYAQSLHLALTEGDGAFAPLSLDSNELSFLSPGFRFAKQRQLPPELVDALDRFRERDLVYLANTYARAAVRRGLWQERFGGHHLPNDPIGQIRSAFEHAKTLGDAKSPRAAKAWRDAFKLRDKFVGQYERNFNVNLFDPSAAWKVEIAQKRNAGLLTDAEVKRLNDEIIPGLQGTLGIEAPQGWRRLQTLLMTYNAARVLSFGALSQFIDLGLITAHVPKGQHDLLRQTLREVLPGRSRAALVEDAKMLGLISNDITEHMLNDPGGVMGLGRNAQAVNNWIFKLNGMHWLTNQGRIIATSFAKRSIERWARESASPDAAVRTAAENGLAELGISVGAARRWKAAGMPMRYDVQHAQVLGGLHQFVNESVIHPDASMRGRFGNSAWFRVFWHLSSFMWAMSTQVLQRVWNQSVQRWGEEQGVRKLYAALPMVMLGAYTLPLAALGLEIRWLLDPPDQPVERGGFDYAFSLVNRAGLPGFAQVISGAAVAEQYGRFALISPFGPAVSQVEGWVRQDAGTSLRKALPFYAAVDGVRYWTGTR